MYVLGYIMLQHFYTHFYKFSGNTFLPGYFQQILFYYIFSVRVGQNLVFGQKQFAH